jgi:hypothetical protein
MSGVWRSVRVHSTSWDRGFDIDPDPQVRRRRMAGNSGYLHQESS